MARSTLGLLADWVSLAARRRSDDPAFEDSRAGEAAKGAPSR